MHLTRRDFHKFALAASAAAFASPAFASNPPFTVRALNRLTFGTTLPLAAQFEEQGFEAWLERQLSFPAADAGLARRLAAATLPLEYEAGRDEHGHHWDARNDRPPYLYLEAKPQNLLPLIDYEKHGMSYEERIRPAREVQAAALIRAVHAEAQLGEVMTQFWHDHFNVNALRDQSTAAFFPFYDAVMRRNALGNFRSLLGEVARSPAMLYYLNNDASRASPANENFARELFELHTLGAASYLNDRTTNWSDVPGATQGLAEGYIDQDVYEAARALTGWSIGDGRWIAEGEYAPRTGEFHYIDRWHDPYQKRILGREFRANQGPMKDGELLFDMLAEHPATARFICSKICRRLLADDPPEALVARAVARWSEQRHAPDQIAQVVRLVALSPEFSELPPQKLRRPFEFLAAFLRATGAEVTAPASNYVWLLGKAGWMQHEFRPPTGHADHSSHWANTGTLSVTTEMALYALEDWKQIATADLDLLVPPDITTVGGAIHKLSSRFFGAPLGEAQMKEMLDSFGDGEATGLSQKSEERSWAVKAIAAALSLSPQFLYR